MRLSDFAGIGGLLLGIVNLAWLLWLKRPRLRVVPGAGCALYEVCFLPAPNRIVPAPPRPGVLAQVHIGVTNISERDNTAVGVTAHALAGRLRPLARGERLTSRAPRRVDVSQVFGSERVIEHYDPWPEPTRWWADLLPADLPAGRHVDGYLCFELLNTSAAPATGLLVTITVRDAHGRSHRTTAGLPSRETSSFSPFAANAAEPR